MLTFIVMLIVVGLIAGAIARLLMPGRDPIGLLGTILLGVAGSFVGGFLENLLFYHNQFGIPVSKAATFNYVPGGSFNGRLLPAIPSYVIPDLVPRDQHAIFFNVEFAY